MSILRILLGVSVSPAWRVVYINSKKRRPGHLVMTWSSLCLASIGGIWRNEVRNLHPSAPDSAARRLRKGGDVLRSPRTYI